MASPRVTASPGPRVASPLIIAHRGASALAPENTLAAFRRAIEDGAEGVEFDVRLAKDGVAVVHHDSTLRRTAGLEKRIRELTSDELTKVDVGSWFRQAAPESWSDAYTKETVPTLAATLDSLRNFTGRIFIELKFSPGQKPEPLVRSVCDAIGNSPLSETIIVKSFRLASIPHLHAHCPGVRTAALFAPKIMTILRKEKHLVALAAEFGADELSVHYSLVTKKLMKKASKLGLPVTMWTVDHPRWLRRGIQLGVNAVITNDPSKLLELR